MALPDDVADGDGDFADDAAELGLEDVFHFHGVHDDHVLAGGDAVALGDEDFDDGALDGGAQGLGTGRTDDFGRVADGLVGFEAAVDIERGGVGALAEEVEGGERVLRLIGDLCAGPGLVCAVGRCSVVGCGGQLADSLVDPAGVDLAGAEFGVGEDVAQEVEVGLRAV